jgi:hypothetical protein
MNVENSVDNNTASVPVSINTMTEETQQSTSIENTTTMEPVNTVEEQDPDDVPGRPGISKKPRPGTDDIDLTNQPLEVVDAFVNINDGEEELLGNKPLLLKLKQFSSDNDHLLNEKVKIPLDEVNIKLSTAKDLINDFDISYNQKSFVIHGIFTSYLLKKGKMFLIIKALVKRQGHKFEAWFAKNFDAKLLRSVQDYMGLAKIGAYRYAPLGLERLKAIKRVLTAVELQGQDPLGDFLGDNLRNLIKPNEPITDLEDIDKQIDTLIWNKRLNKEGVSTITEAKCKALVDAGILFKPMLLKEFIARQIAGKDLNDFVEELLSNDGSFNPVNAPEAPTVNKSEEFKNTTSKFLYSVELAINDTEFIQDVPLEDVNSLIQQLTALAALISNRDQEQA